MGTEKGNVEKNIPADETMSELDSEDAVNPLYSLSTSMSDHLSLGRQRTSAAAVDQAANESTQAQRSVTNPQPDDPASAVRPSDVSKSGVSSSGSLPSMSALQISRPPQSSAVSDEQQQPATVKLQPPPVVPVRLVRAPSSAKPATNIPQVDCPEKIVICLDISKEMEKKNFILRQGDKKTPMDLVTRALNIFLQTKQSLNSHHEFALMFLDDCAKWVCDFTDDPERIMTFLAEMKNCVDVDNCCDLSTVFTEVASHVVPHEVPSETSPPYIIRVILIYGRSYCEPVFSVAKHRQALQASDYFCVDAFYLHDPASDENQCKSIFHHLCSLDVKGNSYVLEASKNPTKVFDCMAQLLAHPLQRPLQHDLNYSLLANGSQSATDSRS